ncbi:MAG: N-acetyl-gamma-glutamyl-phosphate reductase [bacterium]|jgi:N-acetyl-gamma-glutamyl-phosphate reductase
MISSKKCRVKIVGGTGYSGGELIRLLLSHPQVEIVSMTSGSTTEPTPLHRFWSRLRGIGDYYLMPEVAGEGGDADVVFLCTPHGTSMKLAPAYINNGYSVIDLSADYRFNDPSEREGWYDHPHTSPELCAAAVYGMPELFREKIPDAQLIASPGCYPTSVILALYPAIREGLIELTGIHVSSASGITGAGKKPSQQFHFPEMDENFFAYRIGKHQHLPEIISVLRRATGKETSLVFVPHVLPLQKGILSTHFCRKAKDVSLEEIWKIYQSTYQNEPFIRLYPLGEAPDLQAIQATNFLDIGLFEDRLTGELIIVSAEDNLVKGASGQAVQCLNLKMGIAEDTGLLTL